MKLVWDSSGKKMHSIWITSEKAVIHSEKRLIHLPSKWGPHWQNHLQPSSTWPMAGKQGIWPSLSLSKLLRIYTWALNDINAYEQRLDWYHLFLSALVDTVLFTSELCYHYVSSLMLSLLVIGCDTSKLLYISAFLNDSIHYRTSVYAWVSSGEQNALLFCQRENGEGLEMGARKSDMWVEHQ